MSRVIALRPYRSARIRIRRATLALLRIAITAIFVANAIFRLPITLNPSYWYIGRSVTVRFGLSAVAMYGFRASLGGRPLFGRGMLDG